MTTACAPNGQAAPTAKSAAPSGGPASWFSVMKPVCSRALATARSSRATSIGSSVCELLSAKTSAVLSTNSVTSTPAIDTWSVATASVSTATTAARARSTLTTINRRSSRSVSAPATSPNSSGGSHCSVAARATRNASCVSDATSSGPALSAMPSPRFDTHDEAISQRNPTPSRGGAATSTRRLTSPTG